MLPGDRLVCVFVKQQAVGAHFTTWFLHVTIVAWFRLDDDSEVIVRGLERALQAVEPFEAAGGDEAWFGPRKRPVRLLLQPTPLIDIEAKVRAYLHKKRAWLADETTRKQYEFRPHVTMQNNNEFGRGETFWCDKLYIVEQKGQYKQVVADISLG